MVYKLHVIGVYHLGKLQSHLPVGKAARSQFCLCLEYIKVENTSEGNSQYGEVAYSCPGQTRGPRENGWLANL